MNYLQIAYSQGMNKAAQEFGFASYENFKKEATDPWIDAALKGFLRGGAIGGIAGGVHGAASGLREGYEKEEDRNQILARMLYNTVDSGFKGVSLGALIGGLNQSIP